MDDTQPAQEPNDQGLNKIDLSQLQTFNFGTQWTEVKPVSPGRHDRGDRPPRRDDGHGAPPRDRRVFRKPAGPAASGPGPSQGAPAAEGQPQGERRRFERRDAEPRREFHGGERREGYDRREGGPPFDRAPYLSPYFAATCYPEDTGFAALVKAVRASCRTYQLFEITKAVLEKNDRFVVVVQRTRPERPAPAGEGAPPAKPAPVFMSLPDHLPFDTEDAAIQHVLTNNLGAFFEMQEVEVEAPKGNFPIINKCGITGELLGPPNHHRYQQILQQHHAAKLGRMPFERFRESIISAREPEVIAAWMEKMKKATRYTWRPPAPRTGTTPPLETKAVTPAAAEISPAPDAPAPEAQPAVEATPVATAPAADAPAPLVFESFEDARLHLLANARDKVVRAVDSVRFHGKLIEKLAPGEIRRALEGHVERQRRFPLETANALRGRLRREGFTIFKKGSRGVSYVCAVKRRFRVPGQVFSETISALIDFIEKNPMVHVKNLPKNFLAIEVPPAAPAVPAAPELEAGKPAEGTTPSQTPFAALAPEQAEKLRKMSNDLRWLVMEGYVTEFSDGKLFAPPPMVPQVAKKAEAGEEEHDPVDFPDAPPAAETPALAPAAAETAALAAAPSATTVPVEVAPSPPAAEAAEGKPLAEPKSETQA